MATLSVFMIVKNEAKWLGTCLKSVAALADEMVIGDTGSTDDTVAIAESLGARVINVPWTNDFAAARNTVMGHATGDWLLHMDADEVLDPAGAREIRTLLDTDEVSDAVEITLANYCNDVHAWRWTPVDPEDSMTRGFAGCLPVGLLRLFRNHRGFEYREAVHENITASVHERSGVIRNSEIIIHHYGYECTPEQRKKKARFYLELARSKRANNPHDLKCLHDVAEQAVACGELEEAESACREALAIAPHHMELTTTLATVLLGREAVDEAENLLESLEGLGQTPLHIQVALAMIASYRGRWADAEARLAKVIAASPVAPLATLCLARVRDYQGDGEKASELLASLTAAAPRLEEGHRRRESHALRREGEDLFLSGDREGALKKLVAALALDSDDALIHNDLGVLLHTMGDTKRARESFERALKLAPALDDARSNLASL